MFDNHDNNSVTPPSNLPTEPADIFAGVEKEVMSSSAAPNALKSGLLKPKGDEGVKKDLPKTAQPEVVPGMGYAPPPDSETIFVDNAKPKSGWQGFGKILIAILGVFGVLVIGFGGWYLYQRLMLINTARLSQPKAVENTNVAKEQTPQTSATTTVSGKTSEVLFGDTDTDGDGLSDAEEKGLGADVNKPDSDGDRLSDYDEVKIWLSNPLKTDSDGDGYLDGSEIANGYNPNGPGRFSPPLPVVRFVTTSPNSEAPYTYINEVIKTGK